MADLVIKQNDTWPPLTTILSDEEGTVSLSTAVTIKVLLRPVGGGAPITGVCTKDPDQNWHKGWATYAWQPSDTATVQDFNAEFEVDWGSGRIQTFPNNGYKVISVVDDIG